MKVGDSIIFSILLLAGQLNGSTDVRSQSPTQERLLSDTRHYSCKYRHPKATGEIRGGLRKIAVFSKVASAKRPRFLGQMTGGRRARATVSDKGLPARHKPADSAREIPVPERRTARSAGRSTRAPVRSS